MGEAQVPVKPYVIVVGIDYSDLGAMALEKAFELAAGQPRSEVHAVNVVRNFGEFVMIELPQASPYGLSLDEAADRVQHYVEDQKQRFEAKTGRIACERCVTHLRSEIAADEIARLAVEVEADMIVVGTHGRRGVSRLVLGSVAESVVRRAECPVLVVRPKETDTHVPKIEPPCPRCVEVRQATGGAEMWCEQHSEHHGPRHTYHFGERISSDGSMPLVQRMGRYFSTR